MWRAGLPWLRRAPFWTVPLTPLLTRVRPAQHLAGIPAVQRRLAVPGYADGNGPRPSLAIPLSNPTGSGSVAGSACRSARGPAGVPCGGVPAAAVFAGASAPRHPRTGPTPQSGGIPKWTDTVPPQQIRPGQTHMAPPGHTPYGGCGRYAMRGSAMVVRGWARHAAIDWGAVVAPHAVRASMRNVRGILREESLAGGNAGTCGLGRTPGGGPDEGRLRSGL